MRAIAILLFAMLMIAPGVAAEESAMSPMHGCEDDPSNPDCHDHDENDAPGVGVVAAIGLLGAVAFLARRS